MRVNEKERESYCVGVHEITNPFRIFFAEELFRALDMSFQRDRNFLGATCAGSPRISLTARDADCARERIIPQD